MSDAVPVARGNVSAGARGYAYDGIHPSCNQLYANPTSSQLPYHQSASGRNEDWRQGDGSRHHQGDLERPTPTPGPGRGSRRSPVDDGTGGGSCEDTRSFLINKGDGLAADVICEARGKKQPEPTDLKKVPVKQEEFLKVVKRVQQHYSDSSNPTCSSDCGVVGCLCKLELKELYEENNSLRLRVKAIETISEVLEKNKKELETEKAKNSKLDIAISSLQGRLYKFGCDSSVDLPSDEIFIPGRDRAFVNSLISENGKLLKELKELKKDGGVVETTAQSSVTIGEQQELKEQLRVSEARISELEAICRSSNDDKTAKIVHLEDACQHNRKELQDVEEMCRVLTLEIKKLQADLSESHCQLESSSKELAEWKKMAKNLDTKVLDVSMQKMAVHKESNLSVADQLKMAKAQVDQLETENSRLADQLREVIGMNTRWQRYNEQRETYILKLTKTSQHQQSKITVLEQQKRDLEQTINGLNVMLQKMKEEQRTNTDAAILALEHQVTQREDRISELAEELSALKMYIKNNKDRKGGPGQRPEDRERIQFLEQQEKIHKEDFELERRDRERMQSSNEVLKHRLQDATRKLAAFERQNTRMAPKFTASAYQEPRKLIARGISRPSYATREETYHVSDLETDAHDEINGPSSSAEPLQCPRCATEFTVANHSEFMGHVGICLDQ